MNSGLYIVKKKLWIIMKITKKENGYLTLITNAENG